MSWADTQTNAALQTAHDVDRAYVELVSIGLPFHNDRFKNWDAAIALCHVCDKVDLDEPILDAGACRDPQYPSPFLPGLQKLGYRHLTGCNLDEPRVDYSNGIHYEPGDITKLRHGDGTFGYVACLSVIEHGVDWRLFVDEMARVIRSGGHLFVSFDYWQNKIESKAVAFGAPHNIFDSSEVLRMVSYAGDRGLNLTSPMNLTCNERVVKWYGMEYTFCNLLFNRRYK